MTDSYQEKRFKKKKKKKKDVGSQASPLPSISLWNKSLRLYF